MIVAVVKLSAAEVNYGYCKAGSVLISAGVQGLLKCKERQIVQRTNRKDVLKNVLLCNGEETSCWGTFFIQPIVQNYHFIDAFY